MKATTRPFELRNLIEEGTAALGRLFHEGNIRRMTIRDTHGKTFVEMPLNVGVVSMVLAPFWVALGFVTALATGYTVTMGRIPATTRPHRMVKARARKARRPATPEVTTAAH